MIAASAGALVDTALLGNHATPTLAAFAVTMAVFSPATATVAGALRGVMPFVTPRKEEPDRLLPVVHSGMWLAIAVGGIAAAAVTSVPLIGHLTGVPRTTLDQLGNFPFLLAGSVLAIAVSSSATSVLVALGHSKLLMRAGLLGAAASTMLSILLVAGPGPLPSYGLTGAGIAMLASSLISASVNQVNLRRSTVLTERSLCPGRPDVRRKHDTASIRRSVRAGTWLALAVVGLIATAVIVLSPWVVPLFTRDADVRPQIMDLLPLLPAVVATDALQAVVGFGLIGLRRTVPSFVSTFICYGVLAAVAAPVATSGGLPALWVALALANLLQALGKAYSFHRHSTFTKSREHASLT